MKTHSEGEMGQDLLGQIGDSAKEALTVLGVDAGADPQIIVGAVDQFVYDWQCGRRPSISWEVDDIPYYLGSLWGEQLVRRFGWEWKAITFHEHGNSKAPGVVSPDRSFAIYPIHFIIGCLKDTSVDATILLSFNMLQEGKLADAQPDSYGNVMEQVFRIVPRIAVPDQP